MEGAGAAVVVAGAEVAGEEAAEVVVAEAVVVAAGVVVPEQGASTMGLVGVGFRGPIAGWIESRPPEIECLEITAEHFFDGGHDRLRRLAQSFPLCVHGLGLSLGTPGPLDPESLDRFARVVDVAQPRWISEHVAFTRSDERDLGHLNPLPPTREMLRVVGEHARQVSETCGKPLILENVTSYLRLPGPLTEPEFLGRLCEEADCGLLLDVTNLFINSRNHGFDPVRWLRELPAERIVQLHVVGYTYRDGCWHDYHRDAIQEDLRALIEEVLAFAPVRAVTLERDDNFPPTTELANELRALKSALRRSERVRGTGDLERT